MSRIPKRIKYFNLKAEGLIFLKEIEKPFPYRTELAGPNGVAIHIWMGDRDQNKNLLYRVYRIADMHRDLIQCTYSTGEPTEFWKDQIDLFENEYMRS